MSPVLFNGHIFDGPPPGTCIRCGRRRSRHVSGKACPGQPPATTERVAGESNDRIHGGGT